MSDAKAFDSDYHQSLVNNIVNSYQVLLGESLIEVSALDTAIALFEFPLPVVAHNTAPDPLFIFANRAALSWFEMTWEEFVGMPSRFSAEPDNRATRQEMLDRVARHGYIDDYSGIRISASGKRFAISDSVIWNFNDEQSNKVGQAACLGRLEYL